MAVRIYHIVPGLATGDGVTRVVYSLLKNLDRDKYEPLIVSIAPSVPDQIDAFEKIGVPVLLVSGISSAHPIRLPTHLRVVRQIANILGRERAVIVHTHNFFASTLGRVAAMLANVPIRVVTIHGDVFPWYYGLVSRLLNPLTDRVICISKAIESFVLSKGVPDNKTTVIYNGIPLDKFRPGKDASVIRDELEIPDDAPVIGIVAALEKVKGHVSLLQAAPAILQEYPTARFLCVGGEPWFEPETPQMLQDLVEKLCIGDRVIFTGPREDVPDLLQMMDVFVFPPLKAGFGLALAEAMVTEKPIVATSVGAIPEVLGNDGCGVLVEPGNPSALAQAILDLLRDKDRAREMSLRARARVERLFSDKVMAANHEQLYDGLCREKGL